ncbi:hypothetical protein D0X99_10585 [Algoriphagus lacus]|uniref:Uncharacterized protein n=1 Tax=Algoriphagus lacus TaxID=2056311 RepID=A0A418PSK7_9BACT|nr:hypothetical protein D0X99_10585 [Algoriphagus lacus]
MIEVNFEKPFSFFSESIFEKSIGKPEARKKQLIGVFAHYFQILEGVLSLKSYLCRFRIPF